MSDPSELLIPTFPAIHINAALKHFSNAISDFGQGDWEDSVSKAGKFVEAMLKAFATHCQIPFEKGRKFKADTLMNSLSQLGQGTYDDALRITIPRACRFVYDIASNRGARHDPHEIDPNSMDASAVIPVCSWILAEAVRYAQKGAVDPTQARESVDALTERKYPVIEEVDGRIYLHAKRKSAVDVALVILAQRHPKRVASEDLVAAIRGNGFSRNNAKTAVGRIKKYVDIDGEGRLRLLTTGLQRAEEVIGRALEALAAKR